MKKVKVPKQSRIYAILLTAISVLLITWSVMLVVQSTGSLTLEEKIAIVVFFILAIILEVTAVEVPRFNYASLAAVTYLAMIIRFDYQYAIVVAAFALLIRETFITKQNLWFKLTNYSTSLISVSLAGVVFSVVNQGVPFLSQTDMLQNGIAILVGILAYYSFDKLLNGTALGLQDDDVITDTQTSWNKIRLYMYMIAPIAVMLAVTYFHLSPWLIVLILVPLYAIRRGILYAIQEIDLVDQEELLSQLDQLQESLTMYQEQNRELAQDLNKKIDEQSILVEMSEALGTSVNLESTLEIVVAMIRKMMMYQSCVIFLVDSNDNLVACKSVTPYRDILEYSSLLKLEESIVSLVVQSKKPILIPDMQSMSEQRIFKDERSVICVPLIVKNEIIGVIYVGSNRPGTYNEDHLHLLSILGNAASNAVRSAQLYNEEQNKAFELENKNIQLQNQHLRFQHLNEVGQKLGSSLNLEETQKIIVEGLESMFEYQSIVLFLVRRYQDTVIMAPTKYRSPYSLFFENLQMPLNDENNILGRISKYRVSVLLTDTSKTSLQTILENERCVMIVPMVVESELTGALYIGHQTANIYDDESLHLLEAVSHNAGMALKNAEIFEREAKRAITDGLTGLYSHRYFQERLSEEINHARRRRIGLALVYIDADHFKKLNDTCGHPEGDQCLKDIADIMRKYTRDSDLVCRIGGDEFVILLKEIDKKNASKKAEDIRMAVQSKFHNGPVQITTSIGLSCFPDDGDNKKTLVEAADAALYRSKKLGRNRVTISTGPVSGEYKKEPLPRD